MSDYHDETSDVIEASRTGNSSGTIKSSWPPDGIEIVALLLGAGGGLVVFCGIIGLLSDPSNFTKNITDSTGIKLFIGAGLMLVEGCGLTTGKAWAVSIPLFFCMAATCALGFGLVSNAIPPVPRAMILLSVLAVADLFFMLAQRALSKHRRSMH